METCFTAYDHIHQVYQVRWSGSFNALHLFCFSRYSIFSVSFQLFFLVLFDWFGDFSVYFLICFELVWLSSSSSSSSIPDTVNYSEFPPTYLNDSSSCSTFLHIVFCHLRRLKTLSSSSVNLCPELWLVDQRVNQFDRWVQSQGPRANLRPNRGRQSVDPLGH